MDGRLPVTSKTADPAANGCCGRAPACACKPPVGAHHGRVLGQVADTLKGVDQYPQLHPLAPPWANVATPGASWGTTLQHQEAAPANFRAPHPGPQSPAKGGRHCLSLPHGAAKGEGMRALMPHGWWRCFDIASTKKLKTRSSDAQNRLKLRKLSGMPDPKT